MPPRGGADAGAPPRAVIAATYDAYAAQDLDRLAHWLHPEIGFRQVVQADRLPLSRPLSGRQAVLERLVRLSAVMRIGFFRQTALIAEGADAASRCIIRYESRRSDAAFLAEYAHFWRIEQGLVRELTEFFDTGLAAEALPGM